MCLYFIGNIYPFLHVSSQFPQTESSFDCWIENCSWLDMAGRHLFPPEGKSTVRVSPVDCEIRGNGEESPELLVPTEEWGRSGGSIPSGLTFLCCHFLWTNTHLTTRSSSCWLRSRGKTRRRDNPILLYTSLWFLKGSNLRSDAKACMVYRVTLWLTMSVSIFISVIHNSRHVFH